MDRLRSPTTFLLPAKPRGFARKLIANTLYLPVQTKAVLLLAVVLLGSLLCAYSVVPESYFSNKHNQLNVFLVKFCWGWTLLCVLPSVLLGAFLYTALDWRQVLRHLGRAVVGHVIWLTVTTSFVSLDSYVGECSSVDIEHRSTCLKEGHSWSGFDISGHVFLLTYCMFVITEECQLIRLEVWDQFPVVLDLEHRSKDKLSQDRQQILSKLHELLFRPVQLLESLALAQVLVWFGMVLASVVYFHTFVEKVLGFAISYLAWYCTYRWMYGRPYVPPCSTQAGMFNPLRTIS